MPDTNGGTGAPASIYEDGTYLDRNPTWHAEDAAWKAGHVLAILRRNGVAPASVCEVGCGSGELLLRLADGLGDGVSLTGWDVSPQAIELCRPKERPGLRFVHGDLVSQASESSDLLLAIDVFEHVEDYLGFLRALRGRADHKVFHIPLDLSAQSVLRPASLARARAITGHLHYFTRGTALATLETAGYTVVDSFYTRSGIDLPGGAGGGPLLLPRRLLAAVNEDFAARALGGFSLMVLAR